MSTDPDMYIDDFDEWEVVDVKRQESYNTNSPTVTAINTKPKPKILAKKEDVDSLAKQINEQLSLKNKRDEENLLRLQNKIREQQQMSEYTLKQIENKLNQIAKLQYKQNEEQKKAIKTTQKLTKQQRELSQKITNNNSNNSNNNTMFNPNNLVLPPNNSNNGGSMFRLPNLFWPSNNSLNNPTTNNLSPQFQVNPSQTFLPQPQPNQLPFNSNDNIIDNNINNNNINNNINNNSSHNNDNNNIDTNNADDNININDSIDDDGFDINIWKCPTCGENNDESNKFCPKCGCKNDLLMGSIFDENNNDNREEKKIELNDINNNNIKIPLKLINIVGTTKFEPQERKQIGWILKNTGNFNKFKCNLDCLNKNKIVGLKVINDETGYEFSLDNNEEIYVLFELIAPCLPGKYTIFFSLTNEFNKKVADILELAIDVKPKFNKKKESKIENIVKMGFDDRKKIEYALNKHEWNVQEAVNELIN